MIKTYRKTKRSLGQAGVQSPYNRVGWMRLVYDVWGAVIERKVLVFSVLFLLVTLPILYLVIKYRSPIEAAWYDDAFAYRQTVAITNAGTAQTDFQVAITLNTSALVTAGKMQADCDDIRITDVNGKVLPYWFSSCNTTSTKIWPKVPSLPTTGTFVYLYYGNPSATAGKTKVGTQTYPGLSCKSVLDAGNSSGTGNYWIDPTNGNTSDAFQAYCDQTNDSGGWMLVTQSMIQSEANSSTSNVKTVDVNGGLINTITIGGTPGCTGKSYQILLKDTIPWTKIRADYEFYGGNSCWGVFGNGANGPGSNLISYQAGTDTIRNQVKMGGSNGDNFDGITSRCDNETINFWHSNQGNVTRSAQTILRRNSMSSYAGLSNGVACTGYTDGWKYQNIYVRENSMASSTVTAGTPTNEEKSAGPVAYWKFDEGQGVTAQNSTWKKTGTTTNYITNPSFEVNTTGWSASSTTLTAANSIKPWVGTKYASIVGTGTGTYPRATYSFSGLADGTYAIQFRYKADSLAASTGYWYMWAFSPTLTFLAGGGGFTNTGVSDSAGWVTVKTTFTITSGLSDFQLWYYLNGNGSSTGTLLLDGIQVESGSINNLYCDGSLIGNGSHAWNGTAYASTSTCDAGTDGDVNGAVWKNEDQCISGKCLKYNGTSDLIDINSLYGATQSTYSFWVKYNSLSGFQPIFETGSATTGFAIALYTGSKISIVYNNVDWIRTSTVATTNQWYHIVVVRDSSQSDPNKTKIYINGSEAIYDYRTASQGNTATGTTRIGKAIGSAAGYFNGFIDDVKVYPYARSAAQIKSDFASKGSGSVKGTAASLGSSAKNNDAFSNGLVGYWKMDEASWTNDCTATSVTDSSGNGNNGKACPASTGPTGGAAGKFGNSGNFDGTDEFVQVPHNSTLEPSSITISAWINLTSQATRHLIATKWQGYTLEVSQTGYPLFQIYNGAQVGNTSNTAISWGSWAHIVGTFDNATKTIKTYVNGVETATITTGNSISYNGSTLEFSDCTYNCAKGKLDDVRLYNRALSGKEVRDLYAWAPGPVGYWNLDEKTGITANDSSGNNNTGTLTNSPIWGIGKFGSGVTLTTADKYIDVPTLLPNIINNSLTIEGWINVSLGGVQRIFTERSQGYPQIGVTGTTLFVHTKTTSGTDTNLPYTTLPSNCQSGWHHLAVTWDASLPSNNVRAYCDGINFTSATLVNAINGTFSFSGFRIGYNTSTQSVNGSVDDVRIYNYARTSGQIVEDMNAGHPLGGSPVGSQVGYWKMDEGYGITANNSISGNSNLTLAKCLSATIYPIWSQDAKFGKSLQFTGLTYPNCHYANASYAAWMNTNETTWTFWIKPSNTSQTSHIINRYFGAGTGIAWAIKQVNNNLQLNVSADGTPASQVYLSGTSNALVANQWQHIAITFTPLVGFKIYYNGVLRDTLVFASNLFSNTTNLCVGTDCGVNGPYNGYLDEVKIYNAALTADEIKLDYNRGSAMVLGSTSTTSAGVPDNSSTGEYCVPGSSDSCSAPVGEWKMDEKTGGYAYDTSGNGNVGTITNATWTQGKVGAALNFDGNGDYVNAGTFTSIDGKSAVTGEAWIYPTTVSPTNQEVFVKGTNTLLMRVDSGGVLVVCVNNTTCLSTASGTIVANQWQHIAYSWNTTTDTTYIYVNGRLITSGQETTTTISTGTMYIGSWAGSSEYFNGYIDHVKIYDYARTPAQIAWDYNRGAPVGHWKFDECQGIAANDSSGNGNSGTITIGATGTNTTAGTCTGSAGEAWKDGAVGKYNSSLEFDGTDDYVQIADNALFKPTNAITLSAWIRPSNPLSSYQMIIDKQTGSGSPAYTLRLDSSTGKILFRTSGTSATDLLGNTVLSANTWYHVMGVYDGSTSKIYINGILDKSQNNTGSITYDTTPLSIGRRVDGYYFQGQIDDVKIFNYALTPQQVKTVYNSGAAVQFAPLQGSP